ncbi:reverse transcriptase [Tanacetum coccineum]
MAPQTRSTAIPDDESRESLKESIATLMREEMEKLMAEMRAAAVAATASGSGMVVRPQDEAQRVDNVPDENKVNLISIHLYDLALRWHRQFVGFMGDQVAWPLHRDAILQRFGIAYDDSLGEIKKLRQTGSVQDYIDAFDKLLCRIDLPIEQTMSFFMAGLQHEIELAMPLIPTPRFLNTNAITGPKPLALPAPNANWRNKASTSKNSPFRKQLTQKELEDKRAKGLCFYCDQKYAPGHKCSGQVYCLEVIVDSSTEETGKEGETQHENNLNLSSLTPLLQEFEDVFVVPTSLPPNNSHDHRIPLKEDTQLVNIRPYMHPPIQKDALEVMVKKLLVVGLKKNIIKDKFPIPLIEELIDELHETVILLKLDLRSGYHQIRMWEDDIDKTDFKTHEGHYEFLNLKQLRGFLGLTGYYRRFIKGYAIISHPLTALLKKNAYKWSGATQQAFEALKLAMSQALVLKLPNFNEPFIVETDASGIGVGAVLQQGGHPIAYMSKDLAPKHHSLSNYKKEFLPVLQALEDNENIPADALSRIPNTSELLQLTCSTVSSELYERIKEGWTKENELQAIVHKLQQDSASAKHYSWTVNVTPRKFPIMAASAIIISSDSSDESVGSPPSRVILFGDIPTVIPSTSVVAPETSTIAPVFLLRSYGSSDSCRFTHLDCVAGSPLRVRC